MFEFYKIQYHIKFTFIRFNSYKIQKIQNEFHKIQLLKNSKSPEWINPKNSSSEFYEIQKIQTQYFK